MLAESSALFAWPGAKSFDADSPDLLLDGGFSGTGDFASFVISIFTSSAAVFEYKGPCEGSPCVRYSYDLPVSESRYIVKSSSSEATVGFHGTFDVNPQTADLISLTVIPTDVSKSVQAACDIRTQMTYAKAEAGAGLFTVPASTEKEYLSKDGALFRDRVLYEGCREYRSESTLTFGDPASETVNGLKAHPALPPASTEVQLRLSTNIDSEKNWAGDTIEATLFIRCATRRAKPFRQAHSSEATSQSWKPRLEPVGESRPRSYSTKSFWTEGAFRSNSTPRRESWMDAGDSR